METTAANREGAAVSMEAAENIGTTAGSDVPAAEKPTSAADDLSIAAQVASAAECADAMSTAGVGRAAAATATDAERAAAAARDEAARADVEARVRQALAFHARNFNCAQAVGCALCDLVDLDAGACFCIMEGFGAGMGGYTQTCGAISGAVAVAGYGNSAGIENPVSKASTYRLVRAIPQRFADEVGSTLCSQIKGLEGEGGPLLSCDECIALGVRLGMEACRG